MQAYLTARNSALRSYVQQLGDTGRVLDVGCGTGLSLRAITEDGSRGVRLFGTDFSHTMAVQTRASLGGANVRLSLADARRLPYPDNTFDVVYTTRFIHQFEDKKSIVDELRRVTKPGGTLIVEFYGRFFHQLRYWFSRQTASRESFFSHFPSQSEVRHAVGRPFDKVPLRLGGAKLVMSVFGESGLRNLTRLIGRGPFSFLVDEYFVVVRK